MTPSYMSCFVCPVEYEWMTAALKRVWELAR